MIDSFFNRKQTRRGFIKTGGAVAMGIIATQLLKPAFGANDEDIPKISVKGTVFNDINQNGIQDSGEPGVPNVLVSDGISVVCTSSDGSYELYTPNSPLNQYSKKFIFITTPGGYQLNSKSFYRDLSAPYEQDIQIDFALRESSTEQKSFNFAFMADMHVGEGMDKNGILFQETIDDIKNVNGKIGLDFVASGGDMCHRVMELYNAKISQLESDGMPVFHTPGNHDMNEDVAYTEPRKGKYNDYFGPTYYSFDRGNVHFIMLDTTEWTPGLGPHNVIGCVNSDQTRWLGNDLDHVGKDRPVVIMCHIPVGCTTWQRRSDGQEWKVCWEVINNTEILQILREYNVKFIFQGHMHENEHIFSGDIDISSIGSVSGNWWQRDGSPCCPDGSPPGYLVVSVEGDEIIPLYKGTGKDEAYQIEILKPNNGSDIMANFFYGSEKSHLSYRIDEGQWKEMSITGKPVKDSRIPDNRYFLITKHIWLASEEKLHNDCVITVKAIDRYGRSWFQSSGFNS